MKHNQRILHCAFCEHDLSEMFTQQGRGEVFACPICSVYCLKIMVPKEQQGFTFEDLFWNQLSTEYQIADNHLSYTVLFELGSELAVVYFWDNDEDLSIEQVVKIFPEFSINELIDLCTRDVIEHSNLEDGTWNIKRRNINEYVIMNL